MDVMQFRSALGAVVISSVMVQSAQAATTVDFSQLVEQASPAVVRVNVSKKLTQEELLQQQMPELLRRFFGNNVQIPEQKRAPVEQNSYGSAFFMTKDGYLLTNHHVIADARKITITLNDRREVDAELVGSDKRTDVAVLKVKGDDFPILKAGDSNALKVGEPVLAIGSPFGFDYSASAGIVSAKLRTMSLENAVPYIQSDVALNPGNSGGPLFNQRGEVIGVNSRIFSGTGGYMGLSFSIPIDIALDVFNQIRANGKVSHAYLGIFPQDIDRNLAEVYNLPRPEGALITQVTPESAASKAGIKEGDIILSYNNKQINRATDLINMINRTKPNTTVSMLVQRANKKITINATLQAAPDETPASEESLANPTGGPILGLRVRELAPAEKAQVNVSGVVVDVVQPNGLAARSQIFAGDIITRLNGIDTPTLDAFADVLKKLPTNKVVGVSLMRNGVPLIIGLRIEAPDKK